MNGSDHKSSAPESERDSVGFDSTKESVAIDIPPLQEDPIAAAEALSHAAADPKVPATPLLDSALARAEILDTPLLDSALARAEILDTPLLEEADERVGHVGPVIVLPEKSPRPEATSTATPPPVVQTATLTGASSADTTLAVTLPPLQATVPSPPKTIDSEKPTAVVTPARPRDLWRDDLARLHDYAKRKAAEPGDDSASWKTRARLLEELSRGEHPDVVWSRLLPALAATNDPATTDTSAVNDRIRDACEALDALESFEIVELRLCRKVQAFGVFDPIDSMALRPGQNFLIYCELAGLHYRKDQNNFRSRLASRVEIVQKGKVEPVWSESLGTDDACQKRRRDIYVGYKITLPPTLPPGDYELRLTQTDEIAQHAVAAALDVRVLR